MGPHHNSALIYSPSSAPSSSNLSWLNFCVFDVVTAGLFGVQMKCNFGFLSCGQMILDCYLPCLIGVMQTDLSLLILLYQPSFVYFFLTTALSLNNPFFKFDEKVL